MKPIRSINDLLQTTIIDPSPQTNAIRECLQDCNLAAQLQQKFQEQIGLGNMTHHYLTDYDLVNHIVRNTPYLYRIWQACQVFGRAIRDLDTVSLFSKSILRQEENENIQLIKSVINRLQQGNYQQAINLLNTPENSWLAHAMQSLAPKFDPNIRTLDLRSMCLPDFMLFPSFDDGNPHFLMTLQALSAANINEQSNRIISWILAQNSFITVHNQGQQGWCSSFLDKLRYIFQYSTLDFYSREHYKYEMDLYFGYSLDQTIEVGNTNSQPKNLVNILYKQQHLSIESEFDGLLNSRDLLQQDLNTYGKYIQVLLIASQCGITSTQDVINRIGKVIEEIASDRVKIEVANKMLVIHLLYQWGSLASLLDPGRGQLVVQNCIEAIVVESRSHKDDKFQIESLQLIIDLIIKQDDQSLPTKQLFDFSKDNLPLLVSTPNCVSWLLKISDYSRKEYIRLLVDEGDCTSEDYVLALTQLIMKLISNKDSRQQYSKNLLEKLMAQPQPFQTKFVYDQLIQIIDNQSNELIVYQKLLNSYFSYEVVKLQQWIDNANDILTLEDSNELTPIKTIKAVWTVISVKQACMACIGQEDLENILLFLKNLLEDPRVLGFKRMLDLRQIISMLPFEQDDQFMKFIIS